MAIANPAELSPSSSQTSSQESSATASLPSSHSEALSAASLPSSQSEALSASSSTSSPTPALLPVDSASNLYVHPAPLSTPLGIPRLFVSSAHRRLGIASRLLSVAVQTFILGCPLDPARGEVAFTQPTGAGKAVLETWGRGGVRIYEEEQNM